MAAPSEPGLDRLCGAAPEVPDALTDDVEERRSAVEFKGGATLARRTSVD